MHSRGVGVGHGAAHYATGGQSKPKLAPKGISKKGRMPNTNAMWAGDQYQELNRSRVGRSCGLTLIRTTPAPDRRSKGYPVEYYPGWTIKGGRARSPATELLLGETTPGWVRLQGRQWTHVHSDVACAFFKTPRASFYGRKGNPLLGVRWRSGKDMTPDTHTKDLPVNGFQKYRSELVS